MGQRLLAFACLMHVFQTAETGARENIWSVQVSKEVSGELGKAVTLLCTFTTPPHIHDGVLTVIWRVGQPYHGTVVFKCVSNSSNHPCKTTISYMNKFKLLGNPRNNNVSISIHNLAWSDSNKYYCRVELSSDKHLHYEGKSGTKLHLSAPPRISNMSVGFDHHRGYHALCVVEAEPAPSLAWIGPGNISKKSILPRTILKHHIVTELHYLSEEGQYTCLASNAYGKVEGSVYFFKSKQGGSDHLILTALWTALAVKLLLVLTILGVAAFYSKRTGMSTTQASRHAQESTYENYGQRTQ